MIPLQKTYYRCNIAFIVAALLFLAGCAGRAPRPSGPSAPAPAPAPSKPGQRPAPQVKPLPAVPGIVQPTIRIGLKTDVRSATLSTEGTLYFSDGTRTQKVNNQITVSPSFLATIST